MTPRSVRRTTYTAWRFRHPVKAAENRRARLVPGHEPFGPAGHKGLHVLRAQLGRPDDPGDEDGRGHDPALGDIGENQQQREHTQGPHDAGRCDHSRNGTPLSWARKPGFDRGSFRRAGSGPPTRCRLGSVPDTESPPIRVLVIDDEPDLRILLWLAVEADGRCQVVADAADGQEGAQLARSLQPDVVVIDQMMPVLDGVHAVPLIRAAAPSTKVIMMSALGDAQLREKALKAGADAYLEKAASFRPLLDLAVTLVRPDS